MIMNNENKILLERAINNTVILDDKLDRLETEIRSLRAGQVTLVQRQETLNMNLGLIYNLLTSEENDPLQNLGNPDM